MLFRRSTENEWNISQNFMTARAICGAEAHIEGRDSHIEV